MARSNASHRADDWRTTDAQEIERRRARARTEKPRIRNLDPRHPVFSNFAVQSESGNTYSVEIRDLTQRQFACDCVDFRVNGLGTCKHVEAVLMHAARGTGEARAASDRIDLVPDRRAGLLRIERGIERLPLDLRRRFDSDGFLLEDEDEDAVLAECEAVPGVRVSQEVAAWRETRRRRRESQLMRREYELRVQRGEWPPQETLTPLFPYQREGMLHLAFTERAMLADEMGLGKTIQAIAACALLQRLGLVRRVLVVAPASLKGEWEEQIVKFTTLPFEVVQGAPDTRAATYGAQRFFTIANYEQVVRDLDDLNATLQPDLVILDEAQRIKNWTTRTAQSVKRLQSRYAFVLTGTPIESRVDDLHSLMDFLNPSILGPLFRFNREHLMLDARGRPSGYKNLDQLRARIAPYVLRRRRKDVETEMPDRTDRTHYVPLVGAQRERYLELERRVARLAEISSRRALGRREQERFLRDLQMMRILCDTPYILDRKTRACPKLAELEKLLIECSQMGKVKVVVFSEWEGMLELTRDLCARLEIGVAWHTGSISPGRRRVEITRFRTEPECRVLLSTDSGSSGLNLQVARVVINCDVPWTASRMEQRVSRVWRKFQPGSVSVFHLVSERTIEHRMLRGLDRKLELSDSVLDPAADVKQLQVKRGREVLMEKIRGLLRPAAASRPRGAEEIERSLAGALARALGRNLIRIEQRFPESSAPPTMLVVLGRDASAWRPRVEQICQAHLPAGGRMIEVLDRSGEETLRRFEADGLIAPTVRAVRVLWPSAEGAPPAGERRKVARLIDAAEDQLRKVAASGPQRRAEICAAITLAGRASAVAHGVEDPISAEQAVTGSHAERWGDSALLVWRYVQDPEFPAEPVIRAVEQTLAALAASAARAKES